MTSSRVRVHSIKFLFTVYGDRLASLLYFCTTSNQSAQPYWSKYSYLSEGMVSINDIFFFYRVNSPGVAPCTNKRSHILPNSTYRCFRTSVTPNPNSNDNVSLSCCQPKKGEKSILYLCFWLHFSQSKC